MHFITFQQFYSVFTNGEVELEIKCSKNSCGVDPGRHVFGQDGYGNMFIDGKPARVEMRERTYELC